MRAVARCTCASVTSTRERCSRSVRSSSIGDSTGARLATTVSASTTSPSRRLMRESSPASGAETT
jgi:hypothetical protein